MIEIDTSKKYVEFIIPGVIIPEFCQIQCSNNIFSILEKIKSFSIPPIGFKLINNNIKSGTYFIDGNIKTYDEISFSKDSSILEFNMRVNHQWVVIENPNNIKGTFFFDKDDFQVNLDGEIIKNGRDFDKYRSQKDKIHN